MTIEDPELANKYVLDKGDGLEQFSYSGTWGSAKHVKKLPASFLKMKLQRDLRQQKGKIEQMKNHFRTTKMVRHEHPGSRRRMDSRRATIDFQQSHESSLELNENTPLFGKVAVQPGLSGSTEMARMED